MKLENSLNNCKTREDLSLVLQEFSSFLKENNRFCETDKQHLSLFSLKMIVDSKLKAIPRADKLENLIVTLCEIEENINKAGIYFKSTLDYENPLDSLIETAKVSALDKIYNDETNADWNTFISSDVEPNNWQTCFSYDNYSYDNLKLTAIALVSEYMSVYGKMSNTAIDLEYIHKRLDDEYKKSVLKNINEQVFKEHPSDVVDGVMGEIEKSDKKVEQKLN
jgi:hypothetical protein